MTLDTCSGELVTVNSLILQNNYKELEAYISSKDQCIDLESTFRGQTPLTLAISLGHIECIQVLLSAGASCLTRNEFGWTPFQESTSYGNRNIMKLVHSYQRKQYAEWMDTMGKKLFVDISNDLQDVEFEMGWSFTSIIPFISMLCPHDKYSISKKGNNVRINTTLVGFESLSWVRGDISIIFNGGDNPRLVICDHDTKTVQQVWPKDFTITDEAQEEDISVALNTPIHAAPVFKVEDFEASRAKSGFYGFRYDKTEVIEGFPTAVWNIDCLPMVFQERKEHLSVEPLPLFKISEMKAVEREAKKAQKKQQSRFVIANRDEESDSEEEGTYKRSEKREEELIKNYKPGYRNIQEGVDDEEWTEAKDAYNELTAFRDSLEKPVVEIPSLEEYCSDSTPLHLGRPFEIETTKREFQARMWVYEPTGDPNTDLDTIPFKPDTLYPIFTLMGKGNQHFRSFVEFMKFQSPKGFPIQIEIPIGILPLSAQIKFQNIKRECLRDDSYFEIPSEEQGYRMADVIKPTSYDF